MKIIVLGLGNFGAALAKKLTEAGHEVIGVDKNMANVEALKDSITYTICLDSTDEQAISTLPLEDTDVVVVGIGEDEGDAIMTTALMKRLKAKRIISRAMSSLHQTVLEAMGIEEIILPEQETAERLAKKLNIRGIVDSFELASQYNIIEATVPEKYVGKTLEETKFRNRFNVIVLTMIKTREQSNLIGVKRKVSEVTGVATAQTVLEKEDIMVLFGNIKDIQRMLSE